ncbi:MAG: hypothetical protein JWP47_2293 [Polaromonas sp.]|nr:hypothetical protein [Polaromonas sp.]
MTSFVQVHHSTTHPGVARIEAAVGAAQHMRRGFSGGRGLAKLLLSALVAAVLVVAYEVMDTVAEGHLLVLWTSLWAVAFAALALFAGTARRAATGIRRSLDGWSRRVAEAKADERLWKTAKTDPRVMADLQAAASRAEDFSSEDRNAQRDRHAAKVLLKAAQRAGNGSYDGRDIRYYV